MRIIGILILITIGTTFITCSPTKSISTIYSDNYDKTKNLTTVTILPFGQVKISGKWVNTSYDNVSRQYFFRSTDSVTFAVALNPLDGYEFYKKEMKTEEFVKAFYEWESNYFQQQYNGQLRVLKDDTAKNAIIWNISKEPNIDSYFLFGLKGRTAYNLYVSTNKWDEKKKVEFLEKIYND